MGLPLLLQYYADFIVQEGTEDFFVGEVLYTAILRLKFVNVYSGWILYALVASHDSG